MFFSTILLIEYNCERRRISEKVWKRQSDGTGRSELGIRNSEIEHPTTNFVKDEPSPVIKI